MFCGILFYGHLRDIDSFACPMSLTLAHSILTTVNAATCSHTKTIPIKLSQIIQESPRYTLNLPVILVQVTSHQISLTI